DRPGPRADHPSVGPTAADRADSVAALHSVTRPRLVQSLPYNEDEEQLLYVPSTEGPPKRASMPQPVINYVRDLPCGCLLACPQESLDVGVGHRLSGNAPFSTRHVLNDDPGNLTDALTVDRGRCIGELFDQLALLLGRENPLDS